MYVCLCSPAHTDRVLSFSIENASKRLNYREEVYCGAVLAFCRCCHPAGRWLATLKVKKHGLIDKPLTGAVFVCVARRTTLPAPKAVRVYGFGGIVQLRCVWLV